MFFSHQFSPCGRAGGSHLLRYSGLAIAENYGCALKCLAYGNLQLVENPGTNFKIKLLAVFEFYGLKYRESELTNHIKQI